MLFPYIVEPELTPSVVKIQKENLKRFECEHFTQTDVNQLISNRTAFYDDLLIHLWRTLRLDQGDDLALIAVGGYGREEMFPLSDLDFLILSKHDIIPDIEQKITEFVQFLWDCGFDVGHSVRTLSECEEEGRNDITIATNLLESRYLYGNQKIFEKLTALLRQPDFWPIKDFFHAKIEEKNARYQRYNNTSYNLEPDLKYSPGGLRDLHLLYWIALRHTGAKNLDDILQTGFLYPEEYYQLLRNQQFLFRVRFALHLLLRRYDNRLLFDRQIKLSEMLGYQGEGNHAVEQMMKVFFQTLQSILLLSDLIMKHYREHFLQRDEKMDCQLIDEHFKLVGNAICLSQADAFITKPSTILDLFYYLTVYPQAEIHSSTLRELHLALSQPDGYLCDIQSARKKFLSLLEQPQAIQRALLPMHQYGVLTAYLPQWKKIEGLMQFDLFHIYTVDEHTLRVMLKLESFLQPESAEFHPLCSEIFSRLNDRSLLYIAALFHDVAKGRGGDHTELGAVDIALFAQLHGIEPDKIDTMMWLVKQHLLMSVTSQRRDIHDPEVVLTFAEEVKNKERLDYLLCLTVADICATNITLWNSWKDSLLSTLYQYTNQQFQQGMNNMLDNQAKVSSNKAQTLSLLKTQGYDVSDEQIVRLWARCPEEYFLRSTPQQLAMQADLLSGFQGDLLVKVSNRFSRGGTEIFIYCKDQPHLFNKVVCTIGAKKFSIHDAQIITSLDGYAFDSFIITELNGNLAKSDRRRALEEALIEILSSDKMPKFPNLTDIKLQHFYVKTEVRFLNEEKSEQTGLELFALDKAGLLVEVSRIFTELELNLL
ncbi:MAG TPA: [protein-PII] uridylyltransferase, partial [Pasteurellaceae bacterium]|nr:[protein-PII] uridylyltransferase [Pasteurellaceae bacterium]